jgi:crossover junction endodeoxyribonuclease RuvC
MKYDFLLAFDPSLDGCGWAVLDIRKAVPKFVESGVVKGRTKTWAQGTPHQVKLALINAKAQELVAKYQPIYPTVFVEKGFTRFNKSTQAIFKAKGALEVALLAFHIEEMPPSEVRKLIADYGALNKVEVEAAIRQLLRIEKEFESDDESDAIAVALAGHIKYLGGNNK